MKIECKLKRKGGTRVTIEGAEYHFAPQADGRHVADVSNAAHAERLLDITEGYVAVRSEKPAPKAEPSPDLLDAANTSEAKAETTEEQATPTRRRGRSRTGE